MIKVEFFTGDDGLLSGFDVKGHARDGYETVCAAVSSAAYMTANTLTEVLKVEAESDVPGDGMMYVCVSDKCIRMSQTVLEGFKFHMIHMEEIYPSDIIVCSKVI